MFFSNPSTIPEGKAAAPFPRAATGPGDDDKLLREDVCTPERKSLLFYLQFSKDVYLSLSTES